MSCTLDPVKKMGVEKVVWSRLNVRSCRRDPSISQSPNGVTIIQPMRTTKENKSISVNFFVFTIEERNLEMFAILTHTVLN